eukprot:4061961-Alexandrium_andersonii.AAC.1
MPRLRGPRLALGLSNPEALDAAISPRGLAGTAALSGWASELVLMWVDAAKAYGSGPEPLGPL